MFLAFQVHPSQYPLPSEPRTIDLRNRICYVIAFDLHTRKRTVHAQLALLYINTSEPRIYTVFAVSISEPMACRVSSFPSIEVYDISHGEAKLNCSGGVATHHKMYRLRG